MARIWFCICILFFTDCIISLIRDIYNVTYVQDREIDLDRFLENTTVYLACHSIREMINDNMSYIEPYQLKYHFYNHSINYLTKSNGSKWEINEINEIAVLMKMSSYIVFRNQICMKIFNQETSTKVHECFLKVIKIYNFNNATYDFFKLNLYEEFIKLIVSSEQYPYSNCSETYQKFSCLNECFVKKNRLSKYYYTENDTKLIYLNSEKDDLLVAKDENDCFKKCEKDKCKFLHAVTFPYESKNLTYKAFILIPIFEFWYQVVGLICLFNNIYFYKVFKKIVFMKNLNLRSFKRIKKYLLPLRFFMLILLIILTSFFIFYPKIIEFKDKEINRKDIESNLFDIENLILVICFPTILMKKIQPHEITASELENKTNRLIDLIGNISLAFQNRKQQLEYAIEPKVYFKYLQEYSYSFHRCFKVTVNLQNIIRYQVLFLNLQLVIEIINSNNSALFLLPKNQNFNGKCPELINYHFLKRIIRRSNFNKKKKCLEYKKKYSYCQSQSACVDFCIQNEFLKKYKSLSVYSLIDKDHFTKRQWTDSKFIDNITIYEKIKNYCENFFKFNDCEETRFEKSTPADWTRQKIRLNLNFETLLQIDEAPSFYDFFLEITNLQSILFGLNIWKVLFFIFSFLKVKFKLKNCRLFIHSIYLVCSLGFIFHSYFVIDILIKKDLSFTQLYEYAERIEVPDFVFCFEMNQSRIDENHLLTGNYLDKITKNLEINSLFERIEYLNESNRWTNLERIFNFENRQFKIDKFYFLSQKCFKIQLKMVYIKEKSYFNDENIILRIYFNRTLLHQIKKKYFYTIIKNTFQFSKNIFLTYKNLKRLAEEFPFYKNRKRTHSVLLELHEIIYDDQFYLIKHPLSVFYNNYNNFNDVDNYIRNMVESYKKILNFNTLSLPLQSSNFNEIIDDQLFDQFYYQIQNVSDYSSTPDLNYKRSFFINHEKMRYEGFERPCFELNLSFLKRTLYLTNSDNYAKIVLNLLAILSLWLDHSLLDLYPYVHYFVRPLICLYNIFLKAKNLLFLSVRQNILI